MSKLLTMLIAAAFGAASFAAVAADAPATADAPKSEVKAPEAKTDAAKPAKHVKKAKKAKKAKAAIKTDAGTPAK